MVSKLTELAIIGAATLSFASIANAQAQYDPSRKHAEYHGKVQDAGPWRRFKNFISNFMVDTSAHGSPAKAHRFYQRTQLHGCTDNRIPVFVRQTDADNSVTRTELTSSNSLFYYDPEGDDHFTVQSPGNAVHVVPSPTANRVVHSTTISGQELDAVLQQYLDAESTIRFKVVSPANGRNCSRMITLKFGPEYHSTQHAEQPSQPAADTMHNHVTVTDTNFKHVIVPDTIKTELVPSTLVYEVAPRYEVVPLGFPVYAGPRFIGPRFRGPFIGRRLYPEPQRIGRQFFPGQQHGGPYNAHRGFAPQPGQRYASPRMPGRQAGSMYRPRGR